MECLGTLFDSEKKWSTIQEARERK